MDSFEPTYLPTYSAVVPVSLPACLGGTPVATLPQNRFFSIVILCLHISVHYPAFLNIRQSTLCPLGLSSIAIYDDLNIGDPNFVLARTVPRITVYRSTVL